MHVFSFMLMNWVKPLNPSVLVYLLPRACPLCSFRRSGRAMFFTAVFNTLSPSIKQAWISNLQMAKLALGTSLLLHSLTSCLCFPPKALWSFHTAAAFKSLCILQDKAALSKDNGMMLYSPTGDVMLACFFALPENHLLLVAFWLKQMQDKLRTRDCSHCSYRM